ncbi:hypothetical protein [Nostoc sp. UHCC 0252]|uniref:hypothetical protein n=1 Tax=Nostoc sp. UHCC 0252 TaxID=3110241 RepID=UPI002B1FC330|nr:hypothetical protein [Nostoc sp. UHCC 0252]MEA5603989.1 hypothetical protein [Nostoc sp. UHCC 0252]
MKQRFYYMLWSAYGISLCLVTATTNVHAQSIQNDLTQEGKTVLIADGTITLPPIEEEIFTEPEIIV